MRLRRLGTRERADRSTPLEPVGSYGGHLAEIRPYVGVDVELAALAGVGDGRAAGGAYLQFLLDADTGLRTAGGIDLRLLTNQRGALVGRPAADFGLLVFDRAGRHDL